MEREAIDSMEQLADHFFPSGNWHMVEGKGGMNNTTMFIDHASERYVLRRYETHREPEKVRYEHEVLAALPQVLDGLSIPKPVRDRYGDTIYVTAAGAAAASNGRLAALFHYMDGSNPELVTDGQLIHFGQTVGRLSQALAQIEIDLHPVYPPYYRLGQSYPLCSPGRLEAFCANPPEDFAAIRETLNRIGERLGEQLVRIARLASLPHQLIHGDLNASNMLQSEDGQITAILDFEFVTRDLRAMEPAVCLSDMLGSMEWGAEDERRCTAFLQGYASIVTLTEAEAVRLPLLILLRRMDVFMHFLSRYFEGIDQADVVIAQAKRLDEGLNWYKQSGPLLKAVSRRIFGYDDIN
ncbi:phosphotransferase [Paenibacillus sp. SGZ-1009]|uniref:phosphotransferase n=1 Tax=Paenibacillus campi TaxID=3106031 RepID=UPI002B003086|nr:phosphotransferase [Paenibacillus sp. SGZ-1009]